MIEKLSNGSPFEMINTLPFLAAIAYNAHSRKAGRTW